MLINMRTNSPSFTGIKTVMGPTKQVNEYVKKHITPSTMQIIIPDSSDKARSMGMMIDGEDYADFLRDKYNVIVPDGLMSMTSQQEVNNFMQMNPEIIKSYLTSMMVVAEKTKNNMEEVVGKMTDYITKKFEEGIDVKVIKLND